MWITLAGVPGKLKKLLDRLTAQRMANLDGLTSARTANLDHLDTNVNSRAPASTALSNTIWPNALAEKLQNSPIDVLNTPLRANTLFLGSGQAPGSEFENSYATQRRYYSLGDNFTGLSEELNLNTSGVIKKLWFGSRMRSASPSSGQPVTPIAHTFEFEVEIDGVLHKSSVMSDTTNSTNLTERFYNCIGARNYDEPIVFHNSLIVRINRLSITNNVSGSSMTRSLFVEHLVRRHQT